MTTLATIPTCDTCGVDLERAVDHPGEEYAAWFVHPDGQPFGHTAACAVPRCVWCHDPIRLTDQYASTWATWDERVESCPDNLSGHVPA